jgi:Zn finger protein HypA/HybF involved in hydrogenase expression
LDSGSRALDDPLRLGAKQAGSIPVFPTRIIHLSINNPVLYVDTTQEVQMVRKGESAYTKEMLEKVVADSRSYAEVIRKLGKIPNNGMYRYITSKIRFHSISIDHFVNNATRGKTVKDNELVRKVTRKLKWANKEVFVENSPIFQGDRIRKRLLEMGWEYKCAECNMGPEWNGKPLTIQIDHINGVSNDNRLENLRFLCPNCHSQTATFAGNKNKNGDVAIPRKYFCEKCNVPITLGHTRCRKCSNKETGKRLLGKNTKIDWPPTKELLKMVEKEPYTTVAKKLGVSDNAIRKRIKNHPIEEKV